MENLEAQLSLGKQSIQKYKKHRMWLVPLNILCFGGLFFSLYLSIITSFYWWSYLFLGLNSFLASKSTVAFFEYRKEILRLEKLLSTIENFYQKRIS